MLRTPSRGAVVVVITLAILVVGVTTVTPAGAELRHQASAGVKHNWAKVWRQKLRPKADRRYYTKVRADRRYRTKSDSDARYAAKGDSYARSESDSRYAVKPTVLRGTYLAMADVVAASDPVVADISFEIDLPAPPTAHYIATGAPLPPGCLGSPAAPDAEEGHLCVFETIRANVSTVTVYDTSTAANAASTMGAWILARSSGPGQEHVGGVWALRFAAQ